LRLQAKARLALPIGIDAEIGDKFSLMRWHSASNGLLAETEAHPPGRHNEGAALSACPGAGHSQPIEDQQATARERAAVGGTQVVGQGPTQRKQSTLRPLCPPPAFCERRHGGLARRRASACGPRGVSEGQGPHPGRANRRGVGLEDAADNRVPSATTSKSSSFHWPDGREADARLRISEDTTTRFQSSHSCSFPPMRRSLVLDVVPSRWRKC
jgi:hypothetical protein